MVEKLKTQKWSIMSWKFMKRVKDTKKGTFIFVRRRCHRRHGCRHWKCVNTKTVPKTEYNRSVNEKFVWDVFSWNKGGNNSLSKFLLPTWSLLKGTEKLGVMSVIHFIFYKFLVSFCVHILRYVKQKPVPIFAVTWITLT